jgi:CheY-like chemotaxis protein
MVTCAVRRVRIPIDGSGVGEQHPVLTPPSVLLVTADADLRAAGARVLTAEGFEVVTATHSGHALLACMRASRPFDILVTELSADGGTSGAALADTLRRHQPALRTVYLADAGTPAREGVVVRPFTRDDLIAEFGMFSEPAASTPAS